MEVAGAEGEGGHQRTYGTPKRVLCGSRRGTRGSESATSAVDRTDQTGAQSRWPGRSAGGAAASDTSRKHVPPTSGVRRGVGCDPDVFVFLFGILMLSLQRQ